MSKQLTDKEKVMRLLNDLGITFSEGNIHHSDYIILKARQDKHVSGYPGFACEWSFDELTGKFIDIEIWE